MNRRDFLKLLGISTTLYFDVGKNLWRMPEPKRVIGQLGYISGVTVYNSDYTRGTPATQPAMGDFFLVDSQGIKVELSTAEPGEIAYQTYQDWGNVTHYAIFDGDKFIKAGRYPDGNF